MVSLRVSRVAKIYYLQCSVFSKEIMRNTHTHTHTKQKSVTHTQEKKEEMETASKGI